MDFNMTKEQEFLRSSLREFCVKELQPLADRIEQAGEIPDKLISRLTELGLFGIAIEKQYGGAGQGFMEVALAVEELSKVSRAVAFTVGVHYLPLMAFKRNSSDEQKKRFLPAMTKKLASFAFTEASTGSDPAAITTVAKLEGDHYVVNGSKRFISNAPYPGNIVIFARDGDSVSAFIGEKNVAGYSVPALWDLMGLRGAKVADVNLSDWHIPAANLLGKAGGGYRILLDAISLGKVNICAMLLGCAEAALDEAVKYAQERMVGGKPISNFQTIQCLIADIATKIEAMRSMIYRLASMADQGANVMKESAMTKLFVSEAAVEVTTKAMEVQGCYSYATDFKTERLHRDAMIGCTIEGANEIQRIIIARSIMR